MESIEGKTFIVTGITGGNGRAVGEALLSLGAKIVATGRNPQKLQAFVDWANESGYESQYTVVSADLASQPDHQRLLKAVRRFSQNGKIDGFFNLAGRALIGTSFTDEELQAFRQSDLVGPQQLVEALLPHFSKGAVIVLNTSGISQLNARNLKAYSSVKQEVADWSRKLRVEQAVLQRGITVTLLMMGCIATDIWGPGDKGFRPWITPLTKMVFPSPEACVPMIIEDVFNRNHVCYIGLFARLFCGSRPTRAIMARLSELMVWAAYAKS